MCHFNMVCLKWMSIFDTICINCINWVKLLIFLRCPLCYRIINDVFMTIHFLLHFCVKRRRAYYERTISCCDIVSSLCTLSYSTRMATPGHCTVCKKSFERLLHHLNQSLACKAHYMASDKAAATVPNIVSNDGHVNAGKLSLAM